MSVEVEFAAPPSSPILTTAVAAAAAEFVIPSERRRRVPSYPPRFNSATTGSQIIGAPDYCRKRKRTPSSALFLNLQTISTTSSVNHNTMLKASELQSPSYPEASSVTQSQQPSALNNSTSSDQSKQQDPQRSRDGLRLNFHRSISEPQGQRSVIKGLCPPDVVVVSPPSCAPSLHPSKRCRLTPTTATAPADSNDSSTLASNSSCSYKRRPPPFLPSMAAAGSAAYAGATGTTRQTLQAPAAPQPPALQLNPPPGSVSLPNSPCSESSTMQRTLLVKHVSTVTSSGLASKLTAQPPLPKGASGDGSGYLLVDCRPFIAYNVSHIKGAINVNCCNRLNRKRLQMGKATLADLATTKEGKELLKKRWWKEVIVYDDSSESLERLPASHTLFLVMSALVEDGREPKMLLGGLKDFQEGHRSQHCEDHLMTSSDLASKTSSLSGAGVHGEAPSTLLPDLPSPTEMCDTKDIENHPATRVLPHMYLGNMRDASDASSLHRLGVGYVLNVTAKPPSYAMDSGINYKQLLASDNGVQNLRQFFEEAFEFIDEARANLSSVLVHCQAGISRSPTIAVAYLMKHYPGMAMAEAYKFVKTRRSIISPNLNFMGQLWEYEQGLLKDKQVNSDESMSTEGSESGSSSDSLDSCASAPTLSTHEENNLSQTDNALVRHHKQPLEKKNSNSSADSALSEGSESGSSSCGDSLDSCASAPTLSTHEENNLSQTDNALVRHHKQPLEKKNSNSSADSALSEESVLTTSSSSDLASSCSDSLSVSSSSLSDDSTSKTKALAAAIKDACHQVASASQASQASWSNKVNNATVRSHETGSL